MGGFLDGLKALAGGWSDVRQIDKTGFDFREKRKAEQAARDQAEQNYQQQNEKYLLGQAEDVAAGQEGDYNPEEFASQIPGQIDQAKKLWMAKQLPGRVAERKSSIQYSKLLGDQTRDAQRARDAQSRLDDQQAAQAELENLREKNRSMRGLNPAEQAKLTFLEKQAELNRGNAVKVAGMRGAGGVGMGGGSVTGKFRVTPGMTPDQIMSELEQVDPAAAAHVRGLVGYQTDPGTFNTRTGERSYLTGIASLVDPTYDQRQYGVSAGVRKDFTSGKTAGTLTSLNTAISHMDTLGKAAEALGNSNLQDWNTLKNAASTRLGAEQVTQFNLTSTALENELATVFKQTGATDQEIAQWRQRLSSSQSPAQLQGMLAQAVELLGGRTSALEHRYQQGMGKPADFSFLNPKSQGIVDRLAPGVMPGKARGGTGGGTPALKVGDIYKGMRWNGGPKNLPTSWDKP